jgi:hypothetical protein
MFGGSRGLDNKGLQLSRANGYQQQTQNNDNGSHNPSLTIPPQSLTAPVEERAFLLKEILLPMISSEPDEWRHFSRPDWSRIDPIYASSPCSNSTQPLYHL